MGTLLWQLNDCWPGPSWSIIDFEGRPKPAYHAVKAAYLQP
jgi:beta-mannosidase